MSLIYLACPYTHDSEPVREARVAVATAYAASMFPIAVYSPITNGKALESEMGLRSHEEWMAFCLPFVEASTSVTVLCLPEWEESKGVQRELHWAEALKIPVRHVHLDHDINGTDHVREAYRNLLRVHQGEE